MTWSAFVDESQSDRTRDPDVYILAAAVIEDAVAEEARSVMRGLQIGGRKVHWRDEGVVRHQTIINSVSSLPLEHVVVRSCSEGERPERRRRRCLERLCIELEAMAIESATFESRGRVDDKRDLNAVQAFRSSHILSGTLRIYHERGPVEPLLWLPDVVCGAVVSARTGRSTDYLKAIKGSCTLLEG